MTRITIKADKTIQKLGVLENVLDVAIEGIGDELSGEAVNRYRRQLIENDSIGSGTAIMTIRNERLGQGSYGVFIPSYLNVVEEGGPPRDIPVENNPRLDAWVNRRGIDKYAVAESISRKGTEASPFKDDAMKGYGNAIEDVVKSRVRRELKKLF